MSSLSTFVSMYGLLDAALKSAVIVLLAAVVAAALRGRSAAWRDLAWRLSVASLLLLPICSPALPGWRVGWLPQWPAKETRPAKEPRLAAAVRAGREQADRSQPLDRAAIVLPAAPVASTWPPRQEPRELPSAGIEAVRPPRGAMPWLAIIWLAGGSLSLVPLAIGIWRLAGLHRRSQEIREPCWLTLLDELRRQLAVRRRVQLRQSAAALAPLTWGALRPAVLAPSEAGGWSEQRRRFVLLHELAHIRRWDWLAQLAAHFACAVYWFNPLVWWAARQMRIERERACDDIVLASGARASDYARELLALAARFSHTHTTALAAVPMARRRELIDRLHGILDGRRPRAGLTQRAVCLSAALAAAAMVPLAMLRAAPPESAPLKSAMSKPAPSPAPVADSGSVEPQADAAGDNRAPITLANPDAREIWDLTLDEAVQTALKNSQVVRNLGGTLFMPVAQPVDTLEVARQGAKALQAPRAARGENVRVVLARTNDDVTLADFTSGVRNLVSDVERAYWDLYFNYRNLAAVQAGRDSALQTWRKVYALYLAGSEGGEHEKETQAREQYFLFRAQVENSLGLLYTAESRLRHIMGLAPADGRLIRPADEPITGEVKFDWDQILNEALTRSVELRRQRWVIEQNERKLQAARDKLSPLLEAQSRYRWLSHEDALASDKGEDLRVRATSKEDDRGSDDSQQWKLRGIQITVPIGARLGQTVVRNAELVLAKSKASLEDQELELVHVLTNSLRDLDRNYQVSQTTFNRRLAAAKQVEAVKASYDAGKTSFDMLLDAQRRLADAEIAYFRALVDYNIAILQVHFRKGSLLEYNGILLTEGAAAGSEVRKQ